MKPDIIALMAATLYDEESDPDDPVESAVGIAIEIWNEAKRQVEEEEHENQ